VLADRVKEYAKYARSLLKKLEFRNIEGRKKTNNNNSNNPKIK